MKKGNFNRTNYNWIVSFFKLFSNQTWLEKLLYNIVVNRSDDLSKQQTDPDLARKYFTKETNNNQTFILLINRQVLG